MKDYSLGNFISALREKKGLSQYQLGALVGVTDKAVSQIKQCQSGKMELLSQESTQ